MLICLEGVDGAGKSTLASIIKKQIEEDFPDDSVEIIHSSQLDTDVYTAYAEPLMDYVPGQGQHLILDRWHVGEQIYGPLYRKSSQFTAASFAWVDLYLATKGARLWNITQTLETLQKRLSERGEDYLQSHHVDLVRQKFLTESSKSSIFVKSIAPDPRDIEGIASHIILDAEYAERRAAMFHTLGVNYVGTTFENPETVLVVDNTRKNKMFKPDVSDESELFLNASPIYVTQKLGIVSSVSQKRLLDFLEIVSHTSGVVAYSDTVIARLKADDVTHLRIPKPTSDRDYTRQLSIHAKEAGELLSGLTH